MRSIDRVDWSTIAHIVHKDIVVPAARDQHVLIALVKLNAEDSISVTDELALFFHLESQRLSRLIVDSDMAISASHSEQGAIKSEVKSVQVVLWVLASLVQALARCSVPMLERAISLGSNQNICSLERWRDRAPSQSSDWKLRLFCVE